MAGSQRDNVEAAGLWLKANRDTVDGALIPFLRRKFNLTALEAVEAFKRAHSLEYGGGHAETKRRLDDGRQA